MDKGSFKERWKESINRKKLMGFVDKYGFYIVLLLCLCIIGATAFLTFDGKPGNSDPSNLEAGDEQKEPNLPVEGTPEDSPEKIDIVVTDVNQDEQESPEPDQASESAGKPSDADTKQPGQDQKPDVEEPAEEQAEKPATSDAGEDAAAAVSAGADWGNGTMEMPVAGDITRAFAIEELVYSPTLKEWTAHTGVDIGGALGGEVRAALAGTVESIKEDPLKGIVITLSHADGLKTVYTGLSTKDMVKVGQAVEKGQVISGIGRTAAFEITDDPHVHFEVLLDGEYRDPAKYFE
jgi:murein DD-endopeptidase MepM/ murein hydrolase activator NlpD